MSYAIPAFLPFFLAALFAWVMPIKWRYALVLVPLINGLWLFFSSDPSNINMQLHIFELQIVKVDQLSLLFAYLFHIACFICLIYALHLKDKVQFVAGLAYAGSAIGAVFAGDFLTLFIFWELLALTSAFLVFARRTKASQNAGVRYLMIQILSGVASSSVESK